MILRHLLQGGTVRLFADGNGNPINTPAYLLVGGTYPEDLRLGKALRKNEVSWFDRLVVVLWWNDCGLKQLGTLRRSFWRAVKRAFAVAAVLALLSLCVYAQERKIVCEGVERWPVKTLADPMAPLAFKADAVDVSIDMLSGLPGKNKSEFLKADNTRWPEEQRLYKIRGTVVGVKRESDEDFHIVVQSLTTKKTMVVEIPNGACTPKEFRDLFTGLQAAFVEQVAAPTAKYKALPKADRKVVDFAGPGFFDIVHGQKGVAKNGFELHPVVWFKVVQ